MSHDHHGHDHEHHDHEHEHDDEEGSIDVSAWARSADRGTCPACGAAGALQLGGGTFCPSCGEVTTNPGFQAPPQAG